MSLIKSHSGIIRTIRDPLKVDILCIDFNCLIHPVCHLLWSEYKDKNIAIVGMGKSQIDFHLSQVHSVSFDEVWAINAMIGVLPRIDRAFILDPMSRFLDTEDAGTMTPMMRKYLPQFQVTAGPDKGKTAYQLPSGVYRVYD